MATRIKISALEITKRVAQLCMEANYNLSRDVLNSLACSCELEE